MFCLRIENLTKYYFIIMQNLDFFPSRSVIFRYDLKFSEVNRKHVDTMADLQIINDLLLIKDDNYREVLNLLGKEPIRGRDRGTSFNDNFVTSQGSHALSGNLPATSFDE